MPNESIWVGRTFTPGILHRDVRSSAITDPRAGAPGETIPGEPPAARDPACGLAMKPIGAPYVEIDDLPVSARLLPQFGRSRVLNWLLTPMRDCVESRIESAVREGFSKGKRVLTASPSAG